VLAERDLPPPILRDLNRGENYAEEVKQGVGRTIQLITQGPNLAFSLEYPMPIYAQNLGLNVGFEPKGAGRVLLEGKPYTLGPDGFVYDMHGRPYLADGQGNLEALPQLNYYLAVRRL